MKLSRSVGKRLWQIFDRIWRFFLCVSAVSRTGHATASLRTCAMLGSPQVPEASARATTQCIHRHWHTKVLSRLLLLLLRAGSNHRHARELYAAHAPSPVHRTQSTGVLVLLVPGTHEYTRSTNYTFLSYLGTRTWVRIGILDFDLKRLYLWGYTYLTQNSPCYAHT